MGDGKVKKKYIFECDRLKGGGGIDPFDSQKAYLFFKDFTEKTRCAETKHVIHFEI